MLLGEEGEGRRGYGGRWEAAARWAVRRSYCCSVADGHFYAE
jgi:hypothetical protein